MKGEENNKKLTSITFVDTHQIYRDKIQDIRQALMAGRPEWLDVQTFYNLYNNEGLSPVIRLAIDRLHKEIVND